MYIFTKICMFYCVIQFIVNIPYTSNTHFVKFFYILQNALNTKNRYINKLVFWHTFGTTKNRKNK